MVSFIFINQFCMLVIKKKVFRGKKKRAKVMPEKRGGTEEGKREMGSLESFFCASPFE